MDRRHFLQAGGATGLFALIPVERWANAMADAPGPGAPGRFLRPGELDTLRAVTDRFLPGPPEDPDPGAVQARCAEAIDMMLGAFTFDPPLLYAGGPWSNRHGGRVDDMAHFVPPDAFQVLGWRIRLEGSQGKPEREFAGPVTGLQEQYRRGLAALNALAASHHRAATTSDGRPPFAGLPRADQSALMRRSSVADFVAQALGDTINAMYGPPEYGGNHELVGWKATHWPGDVQPGGYTDGQVTEPDAGARALPYTPTEIRTVAGQILPGLQLVD